MSPLQIQVEHDVADFMRRTSAKWPDEVKAWDDKPTVQESVVQLQPQRSQSEPQKHVVRLNSLNSNAQGVG